MATQIRLKASIPPEAVVSRVLSRVPPRHRLIFRILDGKFRKICQMDLDLRLALVNHLLELYPCRISQITSHYLFIFSVRAPKISKIALPRLEYWKDP